MKNKTDGAPSYLGEIIKADMKQLLFVFVAFLLMVVTSCFFVSRIIEKQIAMNAREILTTAEAKVMAQLREAEITLFNASISLRDKLDDGQAGEHIRKYLQDLTNGLLLPENSVSGLTGLFGYVNGAFVDGAGRRTLGDTAAEDLPWYVAAVEARGRVGFTKPRFDIDTGKVIITASKTLSGVNGEDYGVIALDLDLSQLSGYIETLQFTSGGYGLLMDRDMTLIAHPDYKFLGQTMSSLSPEHAKIAGSMRDGAAEIMKKMLKGARGMTVIAFFRAMDNGMFIGIAAPLNIYYRDLYLMTLTLSVLGIVFMSALSYLLINMSLAKLKSEE